jgi:hypothetical protein
MASGDMFGIFCIVCNATINTKSKFGDSGGDMVIDVEGYYSLGYCLVDSKNRFNKNVRSERRLIIIRTLEALDG